MNNFYIFPKSGTKLFPACVLKETNIDNLAQSKIPSIEVYLLQWVNEKMYFI